MDNSTPEPARAVARPAFFGAIAIAFAALLTPDAALACACGCGVFDVGASNLAPNNADSGWSIWFRYSSADQSRNFSGRSAAPAWMNADKRIDTQFLTFGMQYMINHDWGIMIDAPYYRRSFTTVWDDASGAVGTFRLNAFGDARVMGVYSGFSPDRSTGVVFGLKLPTGRWKSPWYGVAGAVYDRDTLPGTGSTDIVLGGYHFGALSSDGKLGYFIQGMAQLAVAIQQGYRPGADFNGAIGATYDLGAFGPITKIAPLAQIIGSVRRRDRVDGLASLDTGYERLMLSPGVDVRIGNFKFYADVEFPVYQRVNHENFLINGNQGQLIAPVLYKVQVGYDF